MIEQISLRHITMPFLHPFRTSFGTQTDHHAIILQMNDEYGNEGFSEIPLTPNPDYCYETTVTAWHVLRDILIPAVFKLDSNNSLPTYDNLIESFNLVRGHQFAKSGLEIAYWSLIAEQKKVPLGSLFDGNPQPIPTGVSIGIQPSKEALLKRIAYFLDQKYQRIKMKIEPGWDVKIIKEVRREFGDDFLLMVDANSAYSLKDIEHLKKFDDFNLLMIEQPLAYDDIIDHIKLQQAIRTPVCLDESIHSFDDARKALNLRACEIINIKIGRVGGFIESQKIANLCFTNPNWKAWCGGMLESGIGRIINVILQTMNGFELPGDTSGSDRYFREDIIDPPVTAKSGFITPPKSNGLGVELRMDLLEKFTQKIENFKRN